MSNNTAIKVSGLSKRYEIGKAKDGSLRGTLSSIFKSAASEKDEFWALKDLNFEVEKGDVVGIIGKNGAGKSTLLKVLSQITKPTEGRIEINGRVASLLEVGTGFHPELTGRENIFLNGTILGMSRKEVSQKFDEIVEFSGVQKFIDTPVKHFSSGMYVRLAFAVAAYLEPEILIIDEVLAVGDAEFQKKCLGKMKDVAGQGRTVLFVSHDLQAVNNLCKKGILLENGSVVKTGNTTEVTSYYSQNNLSNSHQWTGDEGDENVRLVQTKILNGKKSLHNDEDVDIEIKINILNPVDYLVTGFHLYSEFGDPLAYVVRGDYKESNRNVLAKGIHSIQFRIPKHTLSRGKYEIKFDLGIHNKKFICQEKGDLSFEIFIKDQIGYRFPVIEQKKYKSIFRPNWER